MIIRGRDTLISYAMCEPVYIMASIKVYEDVVSVCPYTMINTL